MNLPDEAGENSGPAEYKIKGSGIRSHKKSV